MLDALEAIGALAVTIVIILAILTHWDGKYPDKG
jgi:hypothetical protein